MTAPTAPADLAPSHPPSTSFPRGRAARLAGLSYIVMFGLAIFANFVVREGLIEPGDPIATVENVTESIGLFRLGLLAFLAIFVLDVVIAWALHVVFREVNHDLSLAAAWFRLVYTVLLGVSLVSFFDVIQAVTGDGSRGADQVAGQVMAAMESFESMWLIGLVAFGVHLVLLGALIARSGLAARALGFILVAAGAAYVVDTVAHAVLSDYEAVSGLLLAAVAIPAMIGEGWLGLWLAFTRSFRD